MSTSQVTELLNERSGLLGVSGISRDMHTLLQSREPEAQEAVALFVYRVLRELGSMAAALGGIDALIFSAGIGEHAAEVRAAILEQAGWLGFELDRKANQHGGPRVTTGQSRACALVIPTDEELMIARHTWRLSMNQGDNT